MTSRNSLAKITLLVMLITLLGKALGFVREVLIGTYFGTSNEADALFTALSIPTILFASIAVACGTAFIPIFSSINENMGMKFANKFTNNVVNLVLVIALIMASLCWIFSESIVSIFAIGFDNQTFQLANTLARIVIPTVIFVGISNIMTSYLQANEQYIISNSIVIPQNIIVILAIIFSGYIGIEGVVWGYFLGAVVQILLQLPFMYKNGYRYNVELDLRERNIRNLYNLLIPIFIGTGVQQISMLVDRSLASTLEKGSVSAFNYAGTLNNFVFGIVSMSIATIIYPILSKAVAQKKQMVFKETLRNSMNLINVSIIPLVVILIVLKIQIVELVFERGQFSSDSTQITADVLGYYCIGMLFFGYRDVLNRVFFSLQDTKTPMYNGILAVILNIVCSIALVKFYGLKGIALATSLSAIFTTVLLIVQLGKKEYKLPLKEFSLNFIKCLFAAIIMGVIIHYIYSYVIDILEGNNFYIRLLNIGVSTTLGLLSYLIILVLLKEESIKNLFFKNKSNI